MLRAAADLATSHPADHETVAASACARFDLAHVQSYFMATDDRINNVAVAMLKACNHTTAQEMGEKQTRSIFDVYRS